MRGLCIIIPTVRGLVSSLFVPEYPAGRMPHAASPDVARRAETHTNGAAG